MKKHTITKRDVSSVESLKREKHHHIIHKLHHKHKLSYKTLFYMKEYGPHSHVAKVIIKESIKILMLAAVVSSIGGIHLKSIESTIITILPLLILLPALNDMIGDFGAIISSKFTTMLYMGFIGKDWWNSEKVHELIMTILVVALISAVYIGVLSYVFAVARGFELSFVLFFKVIVLALLSTFSLVGIIIIVSFVGGLWIYKKKEDPNNFLIPITTSIADLGSLMLFSLFVVLFF
ncbi:magnesium transporter [archaeon]|nr:magnesium transporter [archaeon]